MMGLLNFTLIMEIKFNLKETLMMELLQQLEHLTIISLNSYLLLREKDSQFIIMKFEKKKI